VSVSHRTSRLPNVELLPKLAPDAGGNTIDKLIGGVKLLTVPGKYYYNLLAINLALDQPRMNTSMIE
jgi:hypothetical protein